jgi:hypothetical protein
MAAVVLRTSERIRDVVSEVNSTKSERIVKAAPENRGNSPLSSILDLDVSFLGFVVFLLSRERRKECTMTLLPGVSLASARECGGGVEFDAQND